MYQSEFIYTISQLTKQNPKQRPTISEVMAFPLFWNCDKKLSFIKCTSDFFEMAQSYKISRQLDASGVGVGWNSILSPVILQSQFRKYDFNKTIDLLRLIRNKSQHYFNASDEEKQIFGSYPDGFYQYFHFRFPTLLLLVYNVAKVNYQDEPIFNEFFVYKED